MTDFIKGFFSSSSSRSSNNHSDFSDFFTKKSSGDQAKIVRQALREANKEQKKLMSDSR